MHVFGTYWGSLGHTGARRSVLRTEGNFLKIATGQLCIYVDLSLFIRLPNKITTPLEILVKHNYLPR